MCVIILANTVRPTEEIIDKAWNANDHGAGIAWRENGEVVWVKGIMDKQEVKDLCATVPLPLVVHFRIASVGKITEELTHPFVISADCPLDLKGRTKGFILFHNGHWTPWQDKALEVALKGGAKVPSGGAWSDSRAMAWLAHVCGRGILDFIPGQRCLIMGPSSMSFVGEWDYIDIEGGRLWCSNDLFLKRGFTSMGGGGQRTSSFGRGRVCPVGKCTNYLFADEHICSSCAKKREALKEEVAKAGGTANGGVPFITTGILSVQEAETLKKQGEISNNLLKKIRHQHEIIRTAQSQKTIERARRELRTLSETAIVRITSGSRH